MKTKKENMISRLSHSGKNKLFFIAFIIMLVSGGVCEGQTPNWAWARYGGVSANGTGNSVTADASGNVYVAGVFYTPTITFGSITLTNFGTSNFADMYIVKYDGNGNVLWATSAGGSKDDVVNSITTDVFGNVFVTGSFRSTSILFGFTTLTNVDITGTTGDIFIVSYGSGGNFNWAKKAGGNMDDGGISVATDMIGNIYLLGNFKSPNIVFGSTTLTNVSSTNYMDLYLVKYTSNGIAIWAKSAGGTDHDIAYSVAVDNLNNAYITGFFYSPSILFGSITLNNANSQMFIVKYNPSGTVLWANTAIGAIQYHPSVTTDNLNNVYVTGAFSSSTIVFGGTTLLNADTTAVTCDVFFVKYNPSGSVLWAKNFGGSGDDRSYSASTDLSGNLYSTGDFRSSIIAFDSFALNNATPLFNDIFVVKCDSLGTVDWAISTGGPATDYGSSITTDNNDNVYVSGVFWTTNISFGSTILNNPSQNDMFIAKLAHCNLSAPTITPSSITTFCQGDSINLTTSSAYSYAWSNNATTQSISIKSTGNYSVTISDSLGCIGISPITTVTVNPTYSQIISASICNGSNYTFPDGTIDSIASVHTSHLNTVNGCDSIITTNLNVITPNDSIFLQIPTCFCVPSDLAVAWGATSYQWIDCNNGNSIIPGEVNSYFMIIQEGNYAVIVNQNGCIDTSDCYYVLSDGLVNLNSAMEVSISPNPFTSQTTITFAEEQQNTRIEITDVMGRRVNKEQLIVNSKSATIDMSGYAKGIYFVQITDENKNSINKKIVLQ